ncbi:hypothetical protein SAMN04490247_0416 [Salimicrobium halophilum]|uniref:Uncharacterized protein n=1 Tax=Salimicrobium halophilum TaxID=86666 RepID=A0A1G8Q5Z8_9BACI|nr:hypothetical protein SAMN04490247_0416 [Salimicrobium halophilum]
MFQKLSKQDVTHLILFVLSLVFLYISMVSSF